MTCRSAPSKEHGVRRRWRDLGPVARALTLALAAVQLVLALIAWGDLAERPTQLVRGPKALWAGVIAVNFVGPVLYLKKGRIIARVP